MQKLLRIVALVALTAAFTLLERHSLAQTASPRPRTVTRHQGVFANTLINGSDGSQTGTAKLQGNLTTINAPSGQALMLAREPDCSLTLFTGTISFGTSLNYSSTGLFENYERVLHTDAGLTTTGDA